jgi:hypothetical protein
MRTRLDEHLLNLPVLLLVAAVTFLPSTCAFAADQRALGDDAGNPDATPVVCQIRPHLGRPVMMVNGQPRFPMAFMSYFPEQSRYLAMAGHGVHFYSLSLTLTDKWFNRFRQRVAHHVSGIWRGPDEVDFPAVEKALQSIVEVDPESFIFPRIYCDSPAWWDAKYPGEVRGVAQACPLRQSFSSLHWRAETAEVLRKIVRFVSASKYGRHVVGYMICAGQTEEFGDQPDFTSCAQARFRDWIEEKYGNHADVLQRVFGKDRPTISIPSQEQQRTGDCGNFLDPQKSQLVIDYREFHSDECVDSALALCRAVKEASGGRLMTGVFYGYTRIWPDWGHLALRRLLQSDAIDFVSNPFSSGGTRSHLWIGNRDFHTFSENDSVQKAGKLFYYENDIRTSQSRWISQLRPEIDPSGEYNNDAWLGPPTIADSLELLKAVFAKVLINGSPDWWFDLWGGWYDHPEILRLFGEMQRVGDESLRLPHKSAAQIAVVLDENSYRYLPSGAAQFGGRFTWVESQLEQLGKIGAPYDFYLFDDLKDLDLGRCRMIVFLNAFVISDDQRRMLTERCMSQNRLLVWLYAPGLIKDSPAVANVSALLGMNVQMDATHAKAEVTLGLPTGATTYEGAEVSPFFYVCQGADAALGRTADGRVVVAEKAGRQCRHLFVAVPPLPWKALQHFARQANVHLYSEAGDVVFASEHYLAIAAAAAGKRTIRLPRTAALDELLAIGGRAERPEKNSKFDLDFRAHNCRLFRVTEP